LAGITGAGAALLRSTWAETLAFCVLGLMLAILAVIDVAEFRLPVF
jgi:preprotein translocase subunit SecG